ncbi:hypothetical protein ASPVEDRAFT_40263 [Aspergillus versicolor CBS 583.65]|uniref:RTA1 like protein n=1 Tax=Aspergillus versicolor CBS 583.65 TaxID=1036611 RepID=A0A1L9PGT1_ASPVE|nr:uncharacterized protein ASPVEDRAFT_40263 [Aspergillus versicolor CBS 583.65]OJJ00730.1 hypothetical protein ASPVEDRAFT_40263 [Aspergillus versicolor CBS 583.65]
MVLGRLMIHLDAQKLSLVRVSWMTKIFVTGDVISFLMQCGGGGLMSGDNPDSRKTGETITIAGLIVQIVFFGFFLITSIIFHIRINKAPTLPSREEIASWRRGNITARNWVTLLFALYAVSVLILVRSVFRLVEFIDGYGGYLMTHEVFIYVFDAVLMVVVMGVLNYWHPCFVIRGGKGYRDFDSVPLR